MARAGDAVLRKNPLRDGGGPKEALSVMLTGAVLCAVGLASVIASDSFAVEVIGIPMSYGGLTLAFVGHQKWEERRQPVLYASRCLPRLEVVLDPGTATRTDAGAVTGRFRAHHLEFSGTDAKYQVRVLLAGAGGLPWAVYGDKRDWHLKSRSLTLEGALREAGVLRLATEGSAFESVARHRCRWTVSYMVGHSCREADHAVSGLSYSVAPRAHLWRDITDEQLREHLGLLVELAEINGQINVGRPPDAEPAPEPNTWIGPVDKVVKATVALAFAAVVLLIVLDVAWGVRPFGERSGCVSAGAPIPVCVAER